MNKNKNVHIGRFLSMVLRHQPEIIGIVLDKNGWTDVDTLIRQMNAHGTCLNREKLNHIVETNSKKRYAFNEAKDKIRASQGHSVAVDLAYSAQKPPVVLYHGTGVQSVASIKKNGLEKRGRHHVHLSSSYETAITVGSRHGKAIVFSVLAKQMFDEGYNFFLSDNGVWLTDSVPVTYLQNCKGNCLSK